MYEERKVDPDVVRAGFIDNRFAPKKAAPTYGFFGSVLSILSLVFMATSAIWMLKQFANPVEDFRRVSGTPGVQATSFETFQQQVTCYYPGFVNASEVCVTPSCNAQERTVCRGGRSSLD